MRKLLAMSELSSIKGIKFTPQHIRRLVAKGQFPRPIRIGENRIAFVDDEVDAWIDGHIAHRDAEVSS